MNTYKKYILWLMLISALLFCTCDKYDSKITGKVFYTDVNDNINYPAAGAVIAKMSSKDDTIAVVIANMEGEFVFEHQTKGTWKLCGKFFNDTIEYSGCSEDYFKTSGIDQVEQNIILQPIPIITNDDSE